ncbi:hypothetical protein B0H14DRAFT_2592619 [Mycena olivaceomarginata]|nr:hypothetical protein B0H14DRAFT_2592619 [Mycena olivaceomarginata]
MVPPLLLSIVLMVLHLVPMTGEDGDMAASASYDGFNLALSSSLWCYELGHKKRGLVREIGFHSWSLHWGIKVDSAGYESCHSVTILRLTKGPGVQLAFGIAEALPPVNMVPSLPRPLRHSGIESRKH